MDIIEFIILLTITISGTVFGSFFTLAVHRIPRKEDITHQRSYCPKCNHKLGFWDLIPVFSYIFLGGKCRYCKEKIRPRYFILEILSGFLFLALALSYGIGLGSTGMQVADFIVMILFLCMIIIVGGIDKEKYIIPNGLLIYGLGISVLKLTLNMFEIGSIYSNLIGALGIPLIFLCINLICNKIFKIEETPFGEGDIKYLSVLGLFFGFGIQVMIIEISLIMILIAKLWNLIRKNNNKKIAWGYYLSIAAGILLVIIPNIKDLINAFDFMITF